MKFPKYLKTRIVYFKHLDLGVSSEDDGRCWCVTLEGFGESSSDDHVDLAEFKTRQGAREYARTLKIFFESLG